MPFNVTVNPLSKPLPVCTARAKLIAAVDLGDVPNPYRAGTTRRRGMFTWLVTLPDGPTAEQRAYETVSFHPKANLRKIAKAVGVSVPNSGSVDLESWTGRTCIVEIEQYVGHDGQLRSRIGMYRLDKH